MADEYFELPPGGARLGALHVGRLSGRPEWREQLAAVTHVDGTARSRPSSARWRRAFTRSSRLTAGCSGVPVLLNTSFNLAGEPIVNRAVEGYSTFRAAGSICSSPGEAWSTRRASPTRREVPEEREEAAMLKRRGKIVRGLLVIASAVPSIVDLARGVWQAGARTAGSCRSPSSSAYGILLVLAATVEVLAPFIYAIF